MGWYWERTKGKHNAAFLFEYEEIYLLERIGPRDNIVSSIHIPIF